MRALLQKLKTRTNRLFVRAANATSNDLVRVYTHDAPLESTMKKPYFFPDIDTMVGFINHVKIAYQGRELSTYINNMPIGIADPIISVREVAKLPLPQRTSIIVEFRDGTEGRENWPVLTFRFTQKSPTSKAATYFRAYEGNDQMQAFYIDNCAVVMPRSKRRSTVPLIEPIRAEDDTANRHNLELASKARKSGALWGSVTGIGGALAIWLVQTLLDT